GANHGYYFIDGVALYEIPYAGENASFCNNIQLGSGILLPQDVGATYEWTADNDPSFYQTILNPIVSPAQTTIYTLTIKIGTETFSSSVTITPVSAGSDFSICQNSVKTLSGQPLGGVWTGTGVSNGTFNASIAGLGNHTLTYTFAGCSRT